MSAHDEQQAKILEEMADTNDKSVRGFPNQSEWQLGRLRDESVACRAGAAALRRASPETGWQPIETAPKDGRYVLLVERPWRGDGDSFVTVGMWSSAVRALQDDAGWVRYGVGNINAERLTHWQPLPPAPRPQEAE